MKLAKKKSSSSHQQKAQAVTRNTTDENDTSDEEQPEEKEKVDVLYKIVNKETHLIAKKLLDKCSWDWVSEVQPSISPQLLQDYQVFLLCKRQANDFELDEGNTRLQLSPTAEMDRVWHEHLLRPQDYFAMNKVLAEGLWGAGSEGGKGGEEMPILQHYPKTARDSMAMKQKRINRMLERLL